MGRRWGRSFGLGYAFVKLFGAMLKAIAPSKPSHHVANDEGELRSKARDGTGESMSFVADEAFIKQMKQLAAESGGEVEVLERTGRRTKPNHIAVTTLAIPVTLRCGAVFHSAIVSVDGMEFGFHAYVHRRLKADSIHWLYFAVTGPRQKDGVHSEFSMTHEFRWVDLERPWSPLLVKSAFRTWVKRPEVANAITEALRTLPLLPDRLRDRPH